MRQVLQSRSNGEIELVEAPAPAIRPRRVFVETRKNLISAGTERMLLEFGRGNLVQKALQQPDKVRQTLQKVRTDRVSATLEAFAAGKWLMLDNFKKPNGPGWKKLTSISGKHEKGQAAALAASISAVRSDSASRIPTNEVLEVSRWAIRGGANTVTGKTDQN